MSGSFVFAGCYLIINLQSLGSDNCTNLIYIAMKKLFYLAAFAACLFLVSCSSSGLKPTGDVEKDAKALMDYQFQATKDIQEAFSSLSLSKAQKIGEEMDKVAKEFEAFYAKDADLKAKFDAAMENLRPEYEQKLETMGQEMVDKLGGLFSDSEEAAEDAADAVEDAAEAVEDAAEAVKDVTE